MTKEQMTKEQIMEMLRIMREAAVEIRQLRRKNEVLNAKVETFEGCMVLLHASPPNYSVPCSPDVAYALDMQINKMAFFEL